MHPPFPFASSLSQLASQLTASAAHFHAQNAHVLGTLQKGMPMQPQMRMSSHTACSCCGNFSCTPAVDGKLADQTPCLGSQSCKPHWL